MFWFNEKRTHRVVPFPVTTLLQATRRDTTPGDWFHCVCRFTVNEPWYYGVSNPQFELLTQSGTVYLFSTSQRKTIFESCAWYNFRKFHEHNFIFLYQSGVSFFYPSMQKSTKAMLFAAPNEILDFSVAYDAPVKSLNHNNWGWITCRTRKRGSLENEWVNCGKGTKTGNGKSINWLIR